MSDTVLRLILAAVSILSARCACAAEPFAPIALDVAPREVRIEGANRQQQLLVTGRDAEGRLRDLTHLAELSVADEKIASLSQAIVRGVGDGETQLIVRVGDAVAEAPVVVRDCGEYPPVHFANDVVPLLSKQGCNSGGCHGKQGGQNGFHLSVFGFDTEGDYNAIVKHARGRRLFPADPASSLLVAKATGTTPHGGGRRMKAGSADAQLLVNWIGQGAPWGAAEAPTVAGIEILPSERVLAAGSQQQILVTAVYSDGSRRDVTAAASYTTNAETVATVEPGGRVLTGSVPGEAAITINFMGQVAAMRAVVPRAAAPHPYPSLPTHGRIDDLVWQRLRKLGLVPSNLCDDAAFLRRLHLDAIGTLPEPPRVREFLADTDPDKRRKMIDAVLDRPEYADYWALRWSDVLMVDQQTLGERGAYEFHRWLRGQMAANRPYDQWTRELIAAAGNSGKHGPVNFYRALRTPEELTRSVSQAFLGIRMDCAQCHHHPFEKWGQEDFYGLAGYFTNIQRRPIGDRELVYHGGHRPAELPLRGEAVPTRPPGGRAEGEIQGDPRVPLADWITAPDNPWFARLVANRLWKHFLGRGLVEPEDDLRSTNPATNEPLLDHLARRVVALDYDLKAVMREILNSRVYQLSSESHQNNFDDHQNYSHFLVKRMPAEVMLDAISQVTGQAERFAGSPAGTRAIQLWDNRLPSYFLDTFGRSERQSPCECGKSGEPTMAQALHLMNSPEIDAKISGERARVARLIAAGAQQEQIVEQICLAALGRPPRERERKIADKLFAGPSRRQAAEDFLWTVLNSYDFLFVK